MAKRKPRPKYRTLADLKAERGRPEETTRVAVDIPKNLWECFKRKCLANEHAVKDRLMVLIANDIGSDEYAERYDRPSRGLQHLRRNIKP